ncbi:hypothetical protein B0H21DRAFT_826547 [Amylocystis lapponica]|nr:hypothetical protein B0H21DRAFT_826547 [Amylocystis lapponica]
MFSVSNALDHTTSLCLACSSSLPPRKARAPDITQSEQIFFTRCCSRPICPACRESCTHDVSAAEHQSRRRERPSGKHRRLAARRRRVRTRDDDESEPGEDAGSAESEPEMQTPLTPPPYAPVGSAVSFDPPASLLENEAHDERHSGQETPEPSGSAASKYYLKPDDTLVGIALKFAIDGRLLCRLNGLPPSTLRTTPHLLHTRTFLTLPPSARGATPAREEEDPRAVERRARERAEKRFQTLTKEVDWRVARAYVAVADLHGVDDDEDGLSYAKLYERTSEKPQDPELNKGGSKGELRGLGSMEDRAVDRYLDDEEWEERERREGRGVALPKFPYLQDPTHSDTTGGSSRRSWWQW